MDVHDVLEEAKDTLQVKRVFGEPFDRNGLTLIPVAKVLGGAGGGDDERGEGKQAGGGFGLAARPVGVFAVHGEKVEWRPAVDVNPIVLGGQIVALAGLLTLRAFAPGLRRSRRRPFRGLAHKRHAAVRAIRRRPSRAERVRRQLHR
jgi:hypothetical protein